MEGWGTRNDETAMARRLPALPAPSAAPGDAGLSGNALQRTTRGAPYGRGAPLELTFIQLSRQRQLSALATQKRQSAQRQKRHRRRFGDDVARYVDVVETMQRSVTDVVRKDLVRDKHDPVDILA